MQQIVGVAVAQVQAMPQSGACDKHRGLNVLASTCSERVGREHRLGLMVKFRRGSNRGPDSSRKGLVGAEATMSKVCARISERVH